MSQVYLVTGANSGLGLDSVRRLALLPETKRVYMGCRTEQKANAAIDSLEGLVETKKLAYVHFDASAARGDIAKIAEDIDEPLTGLLLNAGGIGHDKTMKPKGPNNVLDIHQINVVGHIQLVEILLKSQKLAKGCKIVFSGSEAARGIPMMMVGKPKLGDTPEWYQQHLTGNFRGARDPMKVYAETKGFASLYFAEWARKNPDYQVWVVSPGGTSGTAAMSADAVPSHFKLMMPAMMPIMKAIGVMHPLQDGTDRYIKALTENHGYASGTFIASKRGTTGKVADQTTLRFGKQYANLTKQRAAFDALSVYVTA